MEQTVVSLLGEGTGQSWSGQPYKDYCGVFYILLRKSAMLLSSGSYFVLREAPKSTANSAAIDWGIGPKRIMGLLDRPWVQDEYIPSLRHCLWRSKGVGHVCAMTTKALEFLPTLLALPTEVAISEW